MFSLRDHMVLDQNVKSWKFKWKYIAFYPSDNKQSSKIVTAGPKPESN